MVNIKNPRANINLGILAEYIGQPDNIQLYNYVCNYDETFGFKKILGKETKIRNTSNSFHNDIRQQSR